MKIYKKILIVLVLLAAVSVGYVIFDRPSGTRVRMYRKSFLCSDLGYQDVTDDFVTAMEGPGLKDIETQYEEWKSKNSNGNCNNVDSVLYEELTQTDLR